MPIFIETSTPEKHDDVQERREAIGETYWLAVSYRGCVLETRERNYYDDSDFYAVVWDEEKGCVREVDYATTRAWTYRNFARVDATDDVRAKAKAWARAELERLDAIEAERRAKENAALMRECDLTEEQLSDLRDTVRQPDFFDGCVALLRTLAANRFRSKFRRSLAEQLRTWLETAPDKRRFPSPFSQRQWGCVIPARRR